MALSQFLLIAFFLEISWVFVIGGGLGGPRLF
jgi:hypothetical protein